jgi:hypothetical protein
LSITQAFNQAEGSFMDCNNRTTQVQSPAMAYVPWQRWGDLYEPCKAFARGTLFAVLDKPFKGGKC